MKRFLTLAAAIVISTTVCSFFTVSADNNSSSNTVLLEEEPPIYYGEDTHRGHRMPQRPVFCTISMTYGIDIPSMDVSQIMTFEICNVEGIIMASFTDETEFISFLFSLSGEHEIRLHFDEFILKGYICL